MTTETVEEIAEVESERRPGGSLVAFVALAFGWSWLFWVPEALVAEGVLSGVPELPALGAFGPSIAAFVLAYRASGLGGVRNLAARAIDVSFDKRWLLVALFLFPLLVLAAIAVANVQGVTVTYPWSGQPVVLLVAFFFVLFLGGPVQEEFGWRGYALEPIQARLGAIGGGVAVGILWAVWHVPLFFVPSETIYYQQEFLGFLASITMLSVVMAWVYANTGGSLLPMLLIHTTFNWSQGMFPVLETDVGAFAFVVLQAAVTLAVVAYWWYSASSGET